MRYLIFGDVHGNLPALEKLLEKEKNSYDQVVCHGDVVNYGPWSNECVDLLSQFPGSVILRGNHEESYISGTYLGKHPVATAFFNFCYPGFTKHSLIKNYGEFHDLKGCRVQHTIYKKYFYPDTDLSGYDLKQNYIIGHSHYQFNRKSGSRRLINTGSVGQNRKYIDVAEYVLYDDNTGLVELKSFVYNIDYVITKMESLDYPELCIDYYKNKRRYNET